VSAPARVPVRSGPIALHAERWGHAGPVVVLGHGFGGSARNFRPQARVLSVHHQVLLFDARGHARSDAPEAPAAYRPECFVADLGAVLDASGAERAIVGGLSMGAGVALRFAIERLATRIGLCRSATELGVGRVLCPTLVEDAMADLVLTAAPRFPDANDVLALYEAAL